MAKKVKISKSPKRKPPTTDLVKLGKRIRELRKEKGFKNFEHFAYEYGFSRAQFGRYEAGEDLRYSSLRRVVKALGVTMEEFFSEGID